MENLIGLHITEQAVQEADWLDYWPEIDRRGFILGIVDSESIPNDAIFVKWEGGPVEADGSYGLEAILVD